MMYEGASSSRECRLRSAPTSSCTTSTSGRATAAMSAATPLLEIEGLNAFYGRARALEDVSFQIGRESVAIIGRNGMGKTTLCNAIMGMQPPEVTGLDPLRGHGARRPTVVPDRHARDRLRAAGQAAVPCALGRRALADGAEPPGVDGRPRRWTIARSTSCSPASANGAATAVPSFRAVSKQMLAIARALLTNPRLLIMDEPSEGSRRP